MDNEELADFIGFIEDNAEFLVETNMNMTKREDGSEEATVFLRFVQKAITENDQA